MIRNYLTTALRNIARHKLYSLINITGLAVGLACVIFILLFIRGELSYDKWIPDTQNLYRVEKTSHPLGRDPFATAQAPFPMAAQMRDEIPEVTAMTRLNYDYLTLFARDRAFREHVAEVEPNFFNVIKLPLTQGDPASVFKDPESLVLSESAARKYFGTVEAIGKVLRTTANCESGNGKAACASRLVSLKVTGIMRDIPDNSQLDGVVFIPNTSIANRIGQSGKSWFGGAFSYVVLVALSGRESFIQRLRSNPGIQDVAVTNAVPFGTYGLGLAAAQLPGHSGMIGLNELTIGLNTAQLMGMRLIAGRFLSDSRGEDQFDSRGDSGKGANEGRNILVDDVAARSFGFTPQQAVGKIIIFGKSHVRIVGVVANVKFNGAREPAMATMYVYDPNETGSVLIRLRPGTVPQTLSFIDRTWHDFAPTKAIDRWFMSDVLGKQYGADERQGELFSVFVVIAIFISCLGLFGLAAFAAGRRTKEIGIRKAFGARSRGLVFLLLWQFSLPVLIANAIAWPIAWYYLHGWLQGFAYRIPLSPFYFLAAGATAMLIAWATVAGQAIIIARQKPVLALRYE